VVEDAGSSANSVAVEDRSQSIINESSPEFHGVSDALVLGSLNKGDEARASPCDDVGFCAGGSNLLHVRSEIGGCGRSEDVVSNKCAAIQGTSVAESFSGAMPKGIVSSDLDEGGIRGCKCFTLVDGVLVVIAGSTEGELVKILAGDIVCCGRGNNQRDFIGEGDTLQHSSSARRCSTYQEINFLDVDQFVRDSGCVLRKTSVIAHEDLDLAVVYLEGALLGVSKIEDWTSRSFGTGCVFHAEHERTLHHGTIDSQSASDISDQTNFDRFGTGKTGGWFFGYDRLLSCHRLFGRHRFFSCHRRLSDDRSLSGFGASAQDHARDEQHGDNKKYRLFHFFSF